MKKLAILIALIALGALAYFLVVNQPAKSPQNSNTPVLVGTEASPQNQQPSGQTEEPFDENDYLGEALIELEAVE
jgi:hypothetical protein